MEKVDVNGDKAHPLYEWLKAQKKQLLMSRVKWNFEASAKCKCKMLTVE